MMESVFFLFVFYYLKLNINIHFYFIIVSIIQVIQIRSYFPFQVKCKM